jgi:L-asparaginase
MFLIANDEAGSGIAETVRRLSAGERGLDAIEAGLRLVETDPKVRSVGANSWPNLLGQLELDAAMMDGDTLRTGSVGALKGYLHPVSVARQVMERLPFEMLVGEGAARFAEEIGAEAGENVTEESWIALRQFLKHHLSAEEFSSWPNIPFVDLSWKAASPQQNVPVDPGMFRDTAVCIVKDANGSLATGTSTSGWAWKYPGRLGDSPLIGAGSYADTLYGAAACTHTGEMTIRSETSHAVVLYNKMGMGLAGAVDEAVNDLRRLRGGLLHGVTIHVADPNGDHRVVHAKKSGGLDYWRDSIEYWYWHDGMTEAELRPAELVFL